MFVMSAYQLDVEHEQNNFAVGWTSPKFLHLDPRVTYVEQMRLDDNRTGEVDAHTLHIFTCSLVWMNECALQMSLSRRERGLVADIACCILLFWIRPLLEARQEHRIFMIL